MANKRMFSRDIVESSTFLKMPLTSQALYFHLGILADDDGIVDGWIAMRILNSNDDDFKLLIAKQFIVPLNDEMLVWIRHFKENNNLAPSKITYSIYRQLLLDKVPDAKDSLIYKEISANQGCPDDLKSDIRQKLIGTKR